jgi:hypothetical protein
MLAVDHSPLSSAIFRIRGACPHSTIHLNVAYHTDTSTLPNSGNLFCTCDDLATRRLYPSVCIITVLDLLMRKASEGSASGGM